MSELRHESIHTSALKRTSQAALINSAVKTRQAHNLPVIHLWPVCVLQHHISPPRLFTVSVELQGHLWGYSDSRLKKNVGGGSKVEDNVPLVALLPAPSSKVAAHVSRVWKTTLSTFYFEGPHCEWKNGTNQKLQVWASNRLQFKPAGDITPHFVFIWSRWYNFNEGITFTWKK